MKKSPFILAITLSAALLSVTLMPATVHAQASTAAATPKPKPLAAADKKFLKDASAAILLEQKYLELTTGTGPGTPETKKVTEKISSDLKKVWDLLEPIAKDKGGELTTEVEKQDAAKVMKLKEVKVDKFDKELVKDLSKETKKTAKLFETGAKSVQEPDLKKVVDDWAAAIKSHDTDLETLEKDLAAAKKK